MCVFLCVSLTLTVAAADVVVVVLAVLGRLGAAAALRHFVVVARQKSFDL